MKKILVPTDFSSNSKTAIQFAIQWSTREKLELVFMHILYVVKPVRWTEDYYTEYAAKQERSSREKLGSFIAGIYNDMQLKPGKHTCLVIQGMSADLDIMDYCRNNSGIDYICIGTRGAGKMRKLFGSNTGNLITRSRVPVLAIPATYKTAKIKSVLYASDFRNYTEEIKKVIDFAHPLKARIDILHFSWPGEIIFDEKTIASALKKKYTYGLKIHFKKNDAIHPLVQNLQKQVLVRKPSVLVMFSNQDRTIFQRLFLSSKAEELSFQLKVPLLVFNKANTSRRGH